MRLFSWCMAVAVGVVVLVGCSAKLNDYSEHGPAFNLFEYFEGNTVAYGMVQDYTGKQTRRFHVTLNGRVENERLILDEDFVYDDGEEENRIWIISKSGDDSYVGTADGVIGQATGEEVGNAVRWRYDFEFVLDGEAIVVEFDDWLYRQDEKRVFNLTKIKKFGVEVGTVTLFFEKQD